MLQHYLVVAVCRPPDDWNACGLLLFSPLLRYLKPNCVLLYTLEPLSACAQPVGKTMRFQTNDAADVGELRRFAYTVGSALVLLAAWWDLRAKFPVAQLAAAAGGVALLTFGLIAPAR